MERLDGLRKKFANWFKWLAFLKGVIFEYSNEQICKNTSMNKDFHVIVGTILFLCQEEIWFLEQKAKVELQCYITRLCSSLLCWKMANIIYNWFTFSFLTLVSYPIVPYSHGWKANMLLLFSYSFSDCPAWYRTSNLCA